MDILAEVTMTPSGLEVTQTVTTEKVFVIHFVAPGQGRADESDSTCVECGHIWPGEVLCDMCGETIGGGEVIRAYDKVGSMIARFHPDCLPGWEDYDYKGEVWRSKNELQ